MHHSTVIFCIRALFATLIAVGWVYQLVFVSVILSQTILTGDDDAETKRWFLGMSETTKLWSVFLTYDVPIAMLLTYFGSGGWGALYLGAATVLHVLLKTVRGQLEATSD